MLHRFCLAASLLAALGMLPVAQASEEPEVDNRPNYNGPYRYPNQSNNAYPATPYGPAPCAYAPCAVGPYDNMYYEQNRDGTGYVGYGAPDGAVDARENQWRTPYRLRREANGDDRYDGDRHRDDYRQDRRR